MADSTTLESAIDLEQDEYSEQLGRVQQVVLVVSSGSTTVHRNSRFFQYANDPSTILVDSNEGSVRLGDQPAIEPAYLRAVESLRDSGRELVADEVYEMLLASKEPDGDPIQLFSLSAMADFLVQHRDISDPISGPSPHGIMQLEWHILGDGLLVIAFVEDERVHCVIQTDEMDVSERMPTDALMRQHGRLIPTRDDETR